jgi:hypothetical protein
MMGAREETFPLKLKSSSDPVLYVRFEHRQEDRMSEKYGPFPFVQLTYDGLRVGEDGDEWLGEYENGLWHCTRDGQSYTDIVIHP